MQLNECVVIVLEFEAFIFHVNMIEEDSRNVEELNQLRHRKNKIETAMRIHQTIKKRSLNGKTKKESILTDYNNRHTRAVVMETLYYS